MTSNRVNLIYEDNARRVLLALLEQIAHARRTSPTNISTKSEPEIEKKGTLASPAIARASSVFPVPGGPIISTPWEFVLRALETLRLLKKLDDLLKFFLGLFNSGNVFEGDALLLVIQEFARDLPNDSALLPPDCICRSMKTQIPMIKSSGAQ